MSSPTRRDVLKTGLAVGALATTGALPLLADGAKATDWVTLGKSGVKVTRLAFGTGTHSGAVQRHLGQDDFNAPGPPRLRPRHPLLRNRRLLRRHAPHARHRAERHPARQLSADVEGDHRTAATRSSASTTCAARRSTDYFDIMLLHCAAHATLAGDTAALAGRHPRSTVRKDHPAAAAPPSMACPPCARCRRTSGSRSP